jgi:hypothetical protein
MTIFILEFVHSLVLNQRRENEDRLSFDGDGAEGQTCYISQMRTQNGKMRKV